MNNKWFTFFLVLLSGWASNATALVETDNHLLGALKDQGFTVIQDLSYVHAKKMGLPALEIRDYTDARYAVSSRLNTMFYSGTHVQGLRNIAAVQSGRNGFKLSADGEGRWMLVSWIMPTGCDMDHYLNQLYHWRVKIADLNSLIYKEMDRRGPDKKYEVPKHVSYQNILKLPLCTSDSRPTEGRNWTSPSTGIDFVWISDSRIWISKTKVNNENFRRVFPNHHSMSYKGRSLNGSWQPAVYVHKGDASAFCAEMTKSEHRQLGSSVYRLPTDAEWTAAAEKFTDMTDHIWEWIKADEVFIRRSARERGKRVPGAASYEIGFRCVLSPSGR